MRPAFTKLEDQFWDQFQRIIADDGLLFSTVLESTGEDLYDLVMRKVENALVEPENPHSFSRAITVL